MINTNSPGAAADKTVESLSKCAPTPAPANDLITEQTLVHHRVSNKALTIEQMQQSLFWDWQKVTTNTVNDVNTLALLLGFDGQMLNHLVEENNFELRVPLPFVSRMRTEDLNDPLLLQVLPLKQEQHDVPGNSTDPLDEKRYNVCPGLVHKYHGRVLLTAAISCPVNCRYCFRRHFAYETNRLTPSSWDKALNYIRNDDTIKEVILSGGEPLLLNDRLISRLLDEIESIEHVLHIRIHSRFPIVIPQRLTDALCERLIKSRCNVALVLHCNHPNEIDKHVEQHLQPLVNSRVMLLNQSVLLKNINDDVETLAGLSEALYQAGVLPYYLHATDRVAGTAHYQVSDRRAQQLSLELTHHLPGYLVPTLVREVSGKRAKTRLPIASPEHSAVPDCNK